jgi:hypothetical protein
MSERPTQKTSFWEEMGLPAPGARLSRGDCIEVYTLVEGSYRRVGAYQPGDTCTSPALGKSVTVAELFST